MKTNFLLLLAIINILFRDKFSEGTCQVKKTTYTVTKLTKTNNEPIKITSTTPIIAKTNKFTITPTINQVTTITTKTLTSTVTKIAITTNEASTTIITTSTLVVPNIILGNIIA